jgi:hypothetical protein
LASKTETGFKKTNASSNDLTNNRANRPTTTHSKAEEKVSTSLGMKSMARGNYESNFIGVQPGVPGNPIPREIMGKSSSVSMNNAANRLIPATGGSMI